jgi:rod shape-determining protein MreB
MSSATVQQGLWRSMTRRFTCDVGIDLGTANTLVYVAGRGILIREPSVVAINKDTNQVLEVGNAARQMLGRTPANIVAVRPLRDGVIADYELTHKMIDKFVRMARSRTTILSNVVVGIPSGVTEVERDAVLDASRKAGAHRAFVIEEPMAAAIGAGLPIVEAMGSMVVDIGGGTTEVAVISLGGIVHSQSIRIAGDEIDESIAAYVRRVHNLYIGDRSAEQAKIEIGICYPSTEVRYMTVKGRDLLTGLPRSAEISSEEVRLAIQEPLYAIIEAVKLTLEATPPELAADCMNQGIVLAGGGALLRGLDVLLEQETGMPIRVAHDPLSCVAIGIGKMLDLIHEDSSIRGMLERASRG